MNKSTLCLFIVSLFMVGCETTPTASLSDRMYDACRSSLRDYSSKPNSKFMVAGVKGGVNNCYYVWGRKDSIEAWRHADANCKAAGNQDCWQYAEDNRFKEFVSIVERRRTGSSRGPAPFVARTPSTPSYGSTSPAASRNPVSQQSGQNCFDRRQNDIVARFTPRVNAARGICQQGNVSRDMWQEVLNAAIACNMPEATRSLARSNIEQSRQTISNACARY